MFSFIEYENYEGIEFSDMNFYKNGIPSLN